MKNLFYIYFLFFISQSLAQTPDSRVLVRNAGIVNGKQTILIKWYTKDLYYPEGVNVYRKEGNREWQKLNTSPVKKLDNLPASEYKKDDDLNFFIPMMNNVKKGELQGLMMLNVWIKSFESEAFSKFLGIQYNDTTVKAGTSYSYKVNKIKGSTEVLIGESISLTAGAETIEATVKDISVKADTNKVLMKWRIEEQRLYAVNVYKESVDKSWKKLNKNPVMISKFKDSLGRLQYPKVYYMEDSLNPGLYNYQLAGVDFFGKESQRSEIFSVEVKDLIPPPAPEDLEDSINNLTVILTWKNRISKDIAGINIYRSVKSDGPYVKLNKSLLAPVIISYTDKVEKAGPYYYYVTSVDAAGNESKSYSIFSEVHDIVPPIKPVGLIAKADTGKIHLTWQMNKESDLMGYRIYRTVNKDDKNKFNLLNASPLKADSFTDKLPKNAKNKFLYKIVAIDSSYNKSEASEIVSVQMPDIIPPVKPLMKSLTNNDNAIEVEWIPNKDVDLKGYDLYRSTDRLNHSKVNTVPINNYETKYIDEGILSATNYFYYMVAIDSAGNVSQPSNTLNGYNNFRMLGSAPSDVKLKYREDKKDVQITWKQKQTEGMLGCKIYRRQNDSQQMISLSGSLKNNEYYDKDIKQGESYYYEIRAYDKAGNISKSELVKITIKQE